MASNDDIRDIHILGKQTEVAAVRSDESDQRSWIALSPVAKSLTDFGIAHCGIMDAVFPFEVVRSDLPGTFFFACYEGEGRVLIDGDWRTVTSGQACVQPPFIPNALKAIPGKRWKFCWIRFRSAVKSSPRVSLHAPALAPFDATSLRCAIEGLYSEARGSASAHALTKWAEIVAFYFTAFSKPFRGNTRLVPIWAEVEERLAKQWTLDQLAEMASLSKEHLRRLCTSSLGRSPIQHVAYLRMHRAAEFLVTTENSIADIAREVGYTNQFSFSDTFKRWFGCRPTIYRSAAYLSEQQSRPSFPLESKEESRD